MTGMLTTLSVLTCVVSGWMTMMYLVLGHPHYLERSAAGGVIFLGAAAIAAGAWRGPMPLRAAAGVWALALLALGLWSLLGNSGDDGWIIIAGLLFVAEGSVSTAGVLRGR
jgi:hypothetical protein